MINLTSNTEIEKFLDQPTLDYIDEQMQKDCPEFSKMVNSKDNEWIGRVMVMAGSDHEGSMIPHGYLLRYQFKKTDMGYMMGIRELRIPESTDEFLDLMLEVKGNPSMFNLVYKGK